MASQNSDMKGKTCIVTGANSGVGKATALGLARLGATVVLVCRNPSRGEAALNEVRKKSGSESLELMICDLGSFEAIRNFAREFLKSHQRLDVLINNAAFVARTRTLTQDGLELQFAVNHLAPFLLTHLLLDLLKASAPARIVNVASTVHHNGTINFDDLQAEKSYGFMRNYAQSKLANVLFTKELARRLEGAGVTANCLHPGVVNTAIMRELPFFLQPLVKLAGLFMLTPEKGARTSLYVATSPELDGVSGEYFVKSAKAPSSSESQNAEIARRLWDISAKLPGCGG